MSGTPSPCYLFQKANTIEANWTYSACMDEKVVRQTVGTGMVRRRAGSRTREAYLSIDSLCAVVRPSLSR